MSGSKTTVSGRTQSVSLWSASEDRWLSERFGGPVLRIGRSDAGKNLTDILAADPVFAYAKLPVSAVDAAEATEALVASGFLPVETEVRFSRCVSAAGAALPAGIRAARPSDRQAVGDLASTAFASSRYFKDPRVARELAQQVKRDWATNFFDGGRGNALWIAEESGSVAGFALLMYSTAGCVIDLIAVDEKHRGRGWARKLLKAAETTAAGKKLIAGTQLGNSASMRLYIADGFTFEEASVVWHRHGAARSLQS